MASPVPTRQVFAHRDLRYVSLPAFPLYVLAHILGTPGIVLRLDPTLVIKRLI